MARISNQSIENVRSAADIVTVIGGYIELVKKGKDFKGKCPFHNDSRPSLSVEPNKQCWRCFTCDIGGNVFEFVIRYESVTFPDAVKILAKNLNIKLEYVGGYVSQNQDSKEEYVKMHEIAEKYYHDLLFNSTQGKKALKHLQNDRGLSLDTIKEFNLGFANKNKDSLLKLLEKKSFSIESMKKSGLVNNSEKWGDYDYFRSRIMFPWREKFGELIAFQGRIFDNDNPQIQKFMNTNGTNFFTKGKSLWGLDITKEYINKESKVIVLEGQMDLLQLYNNGIKNSVVASGTAFTEHHATAIKYLNKDVLILMDGDLAGKDAAVNAGYMLFSKGVEAKIIIPPDNLDPDEWILRDKAPAILSALEKGGNVIDMHYDIFFEKTSASILANNKFIEESLDKIADFEDSIVIKSIIKRIAKLTDMSEIDISDKFDKKKYRPKIASPMEEKSINEKNLLIYDDLISLCCSDNLEVRKFIFDNLNTDWIKSISHREMYDKVYIHLKSEGQIPVSLILDQIEDEKIKNKLNTIVFELKKINPTIQMAKDVLIRLKKEILKIKRASLIEELKNNSDPEIENDILKKVSKIDKEINE